MARLVRGPPMTLFDILVGTALAAVLAFQVYVTVRVFRSRVYEPKQKVWQASSSGSCQSSAPGLCSRSSRRRTGPTATPPRTSGAEPAPPGRAAASAVTCGHVERSTSLPPPSSTPIWSPRRIAMRRWHNRTGKFGFALRSSGPVRYGSGSMADDVFGIVGTTQAGNFQVEQVVAEGGFGVVYRALHGGFRAPVALKCLKVPEAMTPRERQLFLEKFREEAELLFRLSASIPEVVRPLHVDVLHLEGRAFVPFLALEWLEGESLDEVIDRRRRPGEAADRRCTSW